jgi:hypothetical protein
LVKKKKSKITFSGNPVAERSNKSKRKMLDVEVIPERGLGNNQTLSGCSGELKCGQKKDFLIFVNNFRIC